MHDFKHRLVTARKARGLMQWQLAELCGFRPAHLSHFEHGRRLPSLESFYKLAKALDVTADYLLGLNNELNSPRTQRGAYYARRSSKASDRDI